MDSNQYYHRYTSKILLLQLVWGGASFNYFIYTYSSQCRAILCYPGDLFALLSCVFVFQNKNYKK